MALKVIGAGFGRTGTLSMKAALEQLGYMKTHHMLEVMPSADQRKHWLAIAQNESVDWDDVFEGFEASVDFPSSTYYNELLAKYPDAKVVLTVRDPDRWYVSASNTIYAIGKAIPGWANKIIPPIRDNKIMVDGTIWQRVFHGRFEDKAYAKKIFTDYIDQVKQDVPADKLLVFEVKDGWGPLCEFLGQPIPDGDFPHVNDTASFRKMIRNIRLAFGGIYLLGAALLAGLIYAFI